MGRPIAYVAKPLAAGVSHIALQGSPGLLLLMLKPHFSRGMKLIDRKASRIAVVV